MDIIEYEDKYKSEIINLILNIQNKEAKINLSIEEQADLLDIPTAYEKNGGKFWIAIENDQVIGTIALMMKEKQCSILKKFFVKAEYRNKKIGLSLYQTLLEYAKSLKIRYIILDTPSVATASHSFYEKAGFKRVKEDDLPVPYEFPDRNSFLYIRKRQITSVRTENKNLAEVYGEVISVLIFPRQQYCASRL